MDTSNFGETQSSVVILDPKERIKRYGLECLGPAGDGITFVAGTWRPGGEYIQKLIFRNVSTSVKKFKYKLPRTRFFFMAYPEVITLSPGMFKEVDVIFRPVEHDPYDDSILVKMQEGLNSGTFHVPVRACIDKLIVEIDPPVDLGFCTTHQWSQSTFLMHNTGEVDAPFRWDAATPFVLEPSVGIIPAKRSQLITLSLFPLDASVYVAHVNCTVGEGVHAIIPNPVISTRFSAIGKFAFIVLSEASIAFGEVLCGTPPEKTMKEVVLRNDGVVPAEFQLIRHETDREEVFDVYPKQGVLLPKTSIIVTARYHALAIGCYSLDRYTFRTPGNCCTSLTLTGVSMPSQITLFKEPPTKVPLGFTGSMNETGFFDASPANFINFRDLEIGTAEVRVMFLKNNTDKDTTFCIAVDEEGVFEVEPKMGRIPALTQGTPIKVRFSPQRPINYYRRVTILLEDALPLCYDVLGTGFIRAKGEIKEQRPFPLRFAHIMAYRNRALAGLGAMNPDELDALYESNQASMHMFARVGLAGTRGLSVTAIQNPLTRTGDTSRVTVAPAHEYFIDVTDTSCREMTLNKVGLDFAYTPFITTSRPQTIVLTNNTTGKVCVVWQLPLTHGAGGPDHEKTQAIVRKPTNAFDPPPPESRAPAFLIDPVDAEINPGKSYTFNVTFRPVQSNRNYFSELEAFVFFKNQRTFRLVNDPTASPPWCLTLSAAGHTFSSGQLLAKAKFKGGNIRQGKLVFPCCYVGEASYQTVMIRNTSNLPSTFQLEMGWEKEQGYDSLMIGNSNSSVDDEVFTAKPTRGEIAAEGFVLVCIRFAPKQAGVRHSQLLRCKVNGASGDKLLLDGAGGLPFLTCPDCVDGPVGAGMPLPTGASFLNVPLMASIPVPMLKGCKSVAAAVPRGPQGTFYLKPTCVGLSTSRTFTLLNGSRLPCRYRATIDAPEAVAQGIVSITPTRGILRGNEEIQLVIAFAPKDIKIYKFKLKIVTFPVGGRTERVIDARQPGDVKAPEVIQRLSVNIVGNSDSGALVYHPHTTTADVRLVNTTETKEIWLENVSDCDLQYKLFYRLTFVLDTGGVKNKKKTVSQVVPMVAPASALDAVDEHKASDDGNKNSTHGVPQGHFTLKHAGGAERGLGAVQMVPIKTHALLCESPEGMVPARSKARVVFTFHPHIAGAFDFDLFSQLTAVDYNGAPVLITNEESALLRVTANSRDPNQRTSHVRAISADAAHFKTANHPDLASLPLSGKFFGRAAFPILLFEDIRILGNVLVTPVDQLWRQFSLAPLNYDVSMPLTEAEMKLNAASSPDITKIPHYRFEFVPAVQGSGLQTVFIRLSNPGFLTTSYRINFPNEKQLNLEQWCDEDDPSQERNEIISILEELRCFKVTPTKAVLRPGESVVLTLSYNHAYMKYNGLHRVSLLFRIDQGKQFYIDLVGRTLPPSSALAGSQVLAALDPTATATQTQGLGATPQRPSTKGSQTSSRGGTRDGGALAAASNVPNFLLRLPVGIDNVYTLSPLPIGIPSEEAPRQRMELTNVSTVDVMYEIDTKPLENLQEDNFNQPLMRLANPKGLIPALSSIFIEWFFYPLEVRVYDIALDIKYSPAPAGDEGDNGEGLNNVGDSVSAFALSPSKKDGSGSPKNQSPGRSVKISRKTSGATTANPSLSRQSSRMGSRPNMSSNQLLALLANLNEPQFLKFTIRCEGYDPRQAKPSPYGYHFSGGLPPTTQLLPLPNQLITISTDLIDFDIVPQHGEMHRLLVLRNVHQPGVDYVSSYNTHPFPMDAQEGLAQGFGSQLLRTGSQELMRTGSMTSRSGVCSAAQNMRPKPIEFAIDEDSACSLIQEGVLSIWPMRGVVDVDGFVMIHLTVKANTAPIVFGDKVRIIVRESVVPTKRRKAKKRDPILERLQSARRANRENHESVVSRCTSLQREHFDQTPLPFGLMSSMPSTTDLKGEVITSYSKKDHPNYDYPPEEALPQDELDARSFNGTGTGFGTGRGRGPSPERVLRTKAQSMMESGAAEEGEFGSFDWTGGAPQTLGATGRTRASSSRMDSRQSVHGAAAGGSTDGGLQATGPGIGATYVDPLIGSVNVVTLRLTGAVFTLPTAEKLLSRLPAMQALLKTFVIPASVPFIPTIADKIAPPIGIVDAPPSPSNQESGGGLTTGRSAGRLSARPASGLGPSNMSSTGAMSHRQSTASMGGGLLTNRSPTASTNRLPSAMGASARGDMSARSTVSTTSKATASGQPSKARVKTRLNDDILVKRGVELRNVCAFLMEDLFSNVLNTASVSDDVMNCVATAPAGKGLSLPAAASTSSQPRAGTAMAALEGMYGSKSHSSNRQELGLHTKFTGRATFGVYPTELFPSLTTETAQAKAASLVKIDAPVSASYDGQRRSPGGKGVSSPSQRSAASPSRRGSFSTRDARSKSPTNSTNNNNDNNIVPSSSSFSEAVTLSETIVQPFKGLSIDTSTDERDSTFIAAMKARTAAAAAAEEKRVAEQTKDAFGRDEFPLIAAEVMRDTMYNLMQEAMYDEFHIMVEPLSFAVKNES